MPSPPPVSFPRYLMAATTGRSSAPALAEPPQPQLSSRHADSFGHGFCSSSSSGGDSSDGSVRTVVQRFVAMNSDLSSSSGASQSSSDYTVAYRIPVHDLRSPMSSDSLSESIQQVVGAAAEDGSCEVRRCRQQSCSATAGSSAACAEFQNNWPSHGSAISSENSSTGSQSFAPITVEVSVASSAAVSTSGKLQPQTGRRSYSKRSNNKAAQAPSKKAKAAATAAAAAPYISGGDSFPGWRNRRPARHVAAACVGNSSNALPTARAAAAAASANNATDSSQLRTSPPPSAQQSPGSDKSSSCASCCDDCSPLRLLGLVGYYIILWGVTIGFTWVVLELLLIATSRGKFPYYMSAHSYCVASPQLGFSGANPEPGKVTEFASLPKMLAEMEKGLGRLAAPSAKEQQTRDCDSVPPDAAAPAEDELMKPCNISGYVAKATNVAQDVLADRPAFLLQIRRRLGYLPKSGSNIVITCSATTDGGNELPLRYYSWDGSDIVESTDSGSVPTSYFPMLSKHHSAPSVLVAIDTAEKKDWQGQQLSVRCRSADGGPERSERQILLKVKE